MAYAHPYLPNSSDNIKQKMLKEIGLSDIEELFKDIPEKIRFKKKCGIPGPYSEFKVRSIVKNILNTTADAENQISFLGSGVWPHYVPAVVDEVIGRSEFLTSYTPYQAEISQGMLQALFEYQSMICELTGMEASNSSMYDWASALAEACLMAARITHRKTIIVPHYIHPERLTVLKTITEPVGLNVEKISQDRLTGQLIVEDLEEKICDEVAAVYIENPSYLGFFLENLHEIESIVHKVGSLFIAGVDPLSLGIVKPPSSYGADIVVGEGQPLGLGLNFGGSQLGIFACSGQQLIRQMPGRIIGLTSSFDSDQIAYCIILQSREQHIRREKATSNICTNNSLYALAAAVYLSLIGGKGIRKLGEKIMIRSNYAINKLKQIGVTVPLFNATHFKEFTLSVDANFSMKYMDEQLRLQGIQGGRMLRKEFPELDDSALYCVTEVHSLGDIEKLVYAIQQISESE